MGDIRFDPGSGQLLTGAFMDYAMRRADSFSAIDCESNPVPTETNPLGVKDVVRPAMSVHYRRSATR